MEKIKLNKNIDLEFVEKDDFNRWRWSHFNIHHINNYLDSYNNGMTTVCETYYDNSFNPAYTLVKGGFNRLLIVLDNINIDIDRIYYTHLDNTPGVYRIGYRKQYLICYDSSYGLNLDYEMPF